MSACESLSCESLFFLPFRANIVGTTFTSNTAQAFGAAIALTSGVQMNISYSQLIGNGADTCYQSPVGGGAMAIGMQTFNGLQGTCSAPAAVAPSVVQVMEVIGRVNTQMAFL